MDYLKLSKQILRTRKYQEQLVEIRSEVNEDVMTEEVDVRVYAILEDTIRKIDNIYSDDSGNIVVWDETERNPEDYKLEITDLKAENKKIRYDVLNSALLNESQHKVIKRQEERIEELLEDNLDNFCLAHNEEWKELEEKVKGLEYDYQAVVKSREEFEKENKELEERLELEKESLKVALKPNLTYPHEEELKELEDKIEMQEQELIKVENELQQIKTDYNIGDE